MAQHKVVIDGMVVRHFAGSIVYAMVIVVHVSPRVSVFAAFLRMRMRNVPSGHIYVRMNRNVVVVPLRVLVVVMFPLVPLLPIVLDIPLF